MKDEKLKCKKCGYEFGDPVNMLCISTDGKCVKCTEDCTL